MEEHQELAHGRLSGANSKIQAKKEWQWLAELLNCELGPCKEPKQWQATWNDWKCSIKKKWNIIQEAHRKTGGGSPARSKLSDVEERLLGVIGYTALTGDGETPEAGLLANSNIPPLSPPSLFSDSPRASRSNKPAIPPTAPLTTPPRNPCRKRKLDDGVIIDNQNKQIKVMEGIGSKLDNLNKSVQDCANAIREQTECFRQLITLLIKK